MPSTITKLQKIGQRRVGADWNKHVTPWQRRKAKKTVHRTLRHMDEPARGHSRRHFCVGRSGWDFETIGMRFIVLDESK